MTETDYVPPDDSYTNADQPVLWEEPEDDVAGDDFSHLGELWLDEGDGHWLDWGADRDPEHRRGDGRVTPTKDSSSDQGLQHEELRRRFGGSSRRSEIVNDFRSDPSSKDSAWW